MSDQKNTIVGIDLGTTYSCIAAIDELGNPVIGKNRNGDSTTPSVVHFVIGRDTKDCEVGQVAKDSAITEPDRTAQLFKLFLRLHVAPPLKSVNDHMKI